MASSEAMHDHCVDKITEQGFMSIPVGVEGKDIDPLFKVFREVLHDVYETPNPHAQDIVNAFHYMVPGREGDSPSYLIQRRIGQPNLFESDPRPASENKDVLHFTPQTYAHAEAYLRSRGGMPRAMRILISQCTELHEAVKTSVRPFLEALRVDQYMLAPKGLEADDIHLVRVVRYLGNSALKVPGEPTLDDQLAELHFDRSRFTAAIWESSSGLVGTPANNATGNQTITVEELDLYAQKALATPIRHRSGQIKLFTGAGYNLMPEDLRQESGKLPLLLHGVQDDHPGEERDAVIVFINQHLGVKDWQVVDKTETGFEQVRQHVANKQMRYGSPTPEHLYGQVS